MGNPKSADASRRNYMSKTHKPEVVPVTAVPAPIPSRKAANNSYTGVKTDTVGPQVYEPKVNLAKHSA